MRAPTRRLALTLVLAVIALAAPGLIAAQPSKTQRVGIVWIGARPQVAYLHDYFAQAMRELGWVDHQNVVIEARFAEGKIEHLPAMFEELVAARVDVIVAPSPTLVRAAKEATTTIPIVMAYVPDPVGLGFAIPMATWCPESCSRTGPRMPSCSDGSPSSWIAS